MAQQGQAFPPAAKDREAIRRAYRYRIGGRASKRVQRGGFESEQAAAEALERVLERLRREQVLSSRRRSASLLRCTSLSTRVSRRRRRSCAGCLRRRLAASASGV